MTYPDHFLLSGEFHYFRVPRPWWPDRLKQARDLGLDAVSIYVPWNWHEPRPGELDLTGKTVPERDLISALAAITEAGLKCIFRPGPFITNEWRGGGLPDWLWGQHPEILSLDVHGQPSGRNRPYPAITYAHPVYRQACQKWMEQILAGVHDYMAPQGGPIFHLQLDDEPSYWHQLSNPLLADYNPYLVAHHDGPSHYARWLLERYSSLSELNAHHHTAYRLPTEIDPPRQPMIERHDLTAYTDWLDFKLWGIDDYTRFLYEIVCSKGFSGTISQLYPYLLPMQATKHAEYLRRHHLPIDLTNEIYLNLLGTSICPEQKVGHVVFGYELYHMWRGDDHGPAITMELQGSNASFITPEQMELLYALTVARGIKGFNIFMLVGGENPPGYENMTGSHYDIWAPVSKKGELRPHAAALRHIARVVRTYEPCLLGAEPLRDVWWGCYTPYETAMLVGGDGALADVAFAMKYLIPSGEHGLSNESSLQALLTLSSVSLGCLDLQHATSDQLSQVPQLWVFSLDFMDRAVQEKLAQYVQEGGHLVILPMLPYQDEQMQPCKILLDLVFPGMPRPGFAGIFADFPSLFTHVRGTEGESLVVPGKPTLFDDLPSDAVPLAWQADSERPCAFERPVGAGRITILGFPLVYMHTASPHQKDFIARVVERGERHRWAWTSNTSLLAMEQANAQSGLVCVVNPADLPASTKVHYTLPASHQLAHLPIVLDSLTMRHRGALLLPICFPLREGLTLRHATWELVNKEDGPEGITLHLWTKPGELGELVLEGVPESLSIIGGSIQHIASLEGSLTAVVMQAAEEEVKLLVAH